MASETGYHDNSARHNHHPDLSQEVYSNNNSNGNNQERQIVLYRAGNYNKNNSLTAAWNHLASRLHGMSLRSLLDCILVTMVVAVFFVDGLFSTSSPHWYVK